MQNLLIARGEKITPLMRSGFPQKFTNPFSYFPDSLCRSAAAEVMAYIEENPQWHSELQQGKMFGVLVVETCEGNLGFLAAFSGNLQGRNNWEYFVPPVYDLLNPDEFFKVGEREISEINARIALLESGEELSALRKEIVRVRERFEGEILELKRVYKEAKVERERLRRLLAGDACDTVSGGGDAGGVSGAGVSVFGIAGGIVGCGVSGDGVSDGGDAGGVSGAGDAGSGVSVADFSGTGVAGNSVAAVLERITRESQFQKAQIKRAERGMKEALLPLEKRVKSFEDEILELRELRKVKSAALQEEIFRKFSFLNGYGQRKDMLDIFSEFYKEQSLREGRVILPPGGAGECAAPKLLQYAFLNGMRPVAMGEFWWGDSPRGEIRRHGEFYPSCKGKCAPILSFMLQGLSVAQPVFLPSENIEKNLEILFEDNFILAVNKPSGILSVPGKQEDTKKNSAEVGPRVSWKSVPDFLAGFSGFEGGIFVVHRLDMHTSGVLLVAKSEEVYKQLQSQFAGRQVQKKYVAVLDGELREWPLEGVISLPMAPDYDHRPAQIVDFENGKEAVTKYRIVRVCGRKTLVEFYPQTGRTHQLRVHSAHNMGLGVPIVGDLLYGRSANRLLLHAESVQFEHPVTGATIKISAPVPAEFELSASVQD